MEHQNNTEHQMIRATKRIKDMKCFYMHVCYYIIINVVISGVIFLGLLKTDVSLNQIISNFVIYAVWAFWGIGLFFHWIGIFDFTSFGFVKRWEAKKIHELMQDEV